MKPRLVVVLLIVLALTACTAAQVSNLHAWKQMLSGGGVDPDPASIVSPDNPEASGAVGSTVQVILNFAGIRYDVNNNDVPVQIETMQCANGITTEWNVLVVVIDQGDPEHWIVRALYDRHPMVDFNNPPMAYAIEHSESCQMFRTWFDHTPEDIEFGAFVMYAIESVMTEENAPTAITFVNAEMREETVILP